MAKIALTQDISDWADDQVAKGVAPNISTLVDEAMRAKKADSDWLNDMVSQALESVEEEGWVDGDVVLAEMRQWVADLDDKILQTEIGNVGAKRA